MAPPSKTLSNLGLLTSQNPPNLIYGLAVDSRDVKKGYLFIALPGSQNHGAKFANLAFSNGAIAILTDPEGAKIAAEEIKKFDIEVCILDDPRRALAHASALFYGSHPEVVVAVTGTNGKTSVASFCQQIWANVGMNAINLGTTGVEGSWSAPLSHTTPDPIVLHRILAQAKKSWGDPCSYGSVKPWFRSKTP
jgi:UDP-N-acetylmuramoyl-L-alanyl-D-glutamate--2,6-diaminopimelate ligase